MFTADTANSGPHKDVVLSSLAPHPLGRYSYMISLKVYSLVYVLCSISAPWPGRLLTQHKDKQIVLAVLSIFFFPRKPKLNVVSNSTSTTATRSSNTTNFYVIVQRPTSSNTIIQIIITCQLLNYITRRISITNTPC